MSKITRVIILGYGHLGQFLVEQLKSLVQFEVIKIYNRSPQEEVIAYDSFTPEELENVDLVVEVAHPEVIRKFGAMVLRKTNLFIGSPTCLADEVLFESLKAVAAHHNTSIFVPAGAFWGGNDIQKMAELGNLLALTITMTKHPSSFKLESPLKEKNEGAKNQKEPTVLYEGPVRGLCPLAPNNVNTMAGAAVAAKNLGFNGVKARLVSDPKMTDWHVVEVLAEGPDGFHVETKRMNPAKPGAVTGQLTYYSFLASIKECTTKPPGIHIV